ncbi:MAG: D-glycero-beta-D-manno-heptose 1,7-bisphosphate 7-phosphatase [Proteobacteria bacterium]|nr:D-glycero-beta-D-manno-heptose 1,7-bisphosphate 7-phosphatase [Pseudomonadota bacterium]MCH9711351.1 D-glycero-beta-D-manno-heptose 1,7-bisphosphate 7-phosphatase [Pseudomonadota bacterium]MCH9749344.1 D-glycero-beta-D-manno-heptose 1,7-bisphosphate 7-phosphatase [Pseudomonadota bacterium]
MTIKTIFLDRDGVVNKEVGYLHKIKDFEFINGVFDACLYFQSLDYQIIIVTNQSGIERGYYNENDFHIVNNWMLEQFKVQGVDILDVFFCPHGPESNCDCRKPKPGMFNQANKKYGINMEESWMIGDKEADIQAANAAGIQNTILVKSGHAIDEKNSKAKFILNSIEQAKEVITN